MTVQVPIDGDIKRVFFITVDCLRWDFAEDYVDVYPPGVWYRHTPQATYTPTSHSSAFTGLNPPRHGVHRFGDVLRKDNLLTHVENAISYSGITQSADLVPVPEHEHGAKNFPFIDMTGVEEYEATTWQMQMEEMTKDMVKDLVNYDFAFLHDWTVHGSGRSHKETEWTKNIDPNNTLQENRDAYSFHVDFSSRAHEQFLDYLQTVDLYEGTLFVLFGDHGQGLGEDPLNIVGHNGTPGEEAARTPLAFLSPEFDETHIDLRTNARSVDIVPTLFAIFDKNDIPYDDFDHEHEGVDLTKFDGELAGYSMSQSTAKTGIQDSVKTWNKMYLNSGKHEFYDTTPDEDSPFEYQFEPDPDGFQVETFIDYYKSVRGGPDRLVVRETPDEDRMEALGYL